MGKKWFSFRILCFGVTKWEICEHLLTFLSTEESLMSKFVTIVSCTYHLRVFEQFWNCSVDLLQCDKTELEKIRISWIFSDSTRRTVSPLDSLWSGYYTFGNHHWDHGNVRRDPAKVQSKALRLLKFNLRKTFVTSEMCLPCWAKLEKFTISEK